MGTFIAAPDHIDVDGPLVFLAGPVWWGPDAWHDRAVALIAADGPHIHVASPRRDIAASAQLWNPREDATARATPQPAFEREPAPSLSSSADPSALSLSHGVSTGAARTRVFDEHAYNAQMDWETRFLRRAAANGVVLFWLAREREHRCERPHAQTTRFELGEWKQRHVHDGVNLVVGIEPGFTGERYVRRRFAQDCPRVPVCDSLEATCRAAVELCSP